MTFGELKILVEERRVLIAHIEIRLSVKEFDALVYLASSSGRVFTKAQIYSYKQKGKYNGEIISGRRRKKIIPGPDKGIK